MDRKTRNVPTEALNTQSQPSEQVYANSTLSQIKSLSPANPRKKPRKNGKLKPKQRLELSNDPNLEPKRSKRRAPQARSNSQRMNINLMDFKFGDKPLTKEDEAKVKISSEDEFGNLPIKVDTIGEESVDSVGAV